MVALPTWNRWILDIRSLRLLGQSTGTMRTRNLYVVELNPKVFDWERRFFEANLHRIPGKTLCLRQSNKPHARGAIPRTLTWRSRGMVRSKVWTPSSSGTLRIFQSASL
jgi:hypothetical protein